MQNFILFSSYFVRIAKKTISEAKIKETIFHAIVCDSITWAFVSCLYKVGAVPFPWSYLLFKQEFSSIQHGEELKEVTKLLLKLVLC